MQTTKERTNLLKLVYAAVCLALCLVLPILTGQIQQIGQLLSPMHIPVFLAGFLCGPWWALAVGAVAPVLRYFLFHMPPYPTFLAMAFELAAYGVVTGLLYRSFPKKVPYIYLSLVIAMVAGRLVSGLVNVVLYAVGAKEGTYTLAAFLSGHFITAWPALVLHIVLVPAVVIALRRARIIRD